MVSIVGLARDRARSGAEVEGLSLDHHPIPTLRSIEDIVEAVGGDGQFIQTGADAAADRGCQLEHSPANQ